MVSRGHEVFRAIAHGIAGAVLPAFALLLTQGCRDRDSSASADDRPQLSIPLEGVWDVCAEVLVPMHYVISIDKSGTGGGILMEAEGGVFRQYRFRVTGPETIQIEGAQRGPYKLEPSSVQYLLDVVQLKDPPAELRFSRGRASTSEMPVQDGRLFVCGLFEERGIPMTRVSASQRIGLPFKDILLDGDLTASPVGAVRILSDGPVIGETTMYEKPVRPSGNVRSFMVEGHRIDLQNPNPTVENGVFTTKQFGDIEVVWLGSRIPQGNIAQIRATYTQIQAIRNWVKGRTNPKPSDVLSVPIMGIWSIKGMPPDWRYRFSETKDYGLLEFVEFVGTSGHPMMSHRFHAAGPDTIRIEGAEGRGPFAGGLATPELLVRVIWLFEPPATLRFTGNTSIIQVHGMFAGTPVTLVRLAE